MKREQRERGEKANSALREQMFILHGPVPTAVPGGASGFQEEEAKGRARAEDSLNINCCSS